MAHKTHGVGSGAQDDPSPGGLCLGRRLWCQAARIPAICSSPPRPGWSEPFPAAHRKCQAPLGPRQRPLLTISAPCLLALHLGLVTPIPQLGGGRIPTGLGTKPTHVSGLGLRTIPILVSCVCEGCADDAGVRGLSAGLLGPSHSRGRSLSRTNTRFLLFLLPISRTSPAKTGCSGALNSRKFPSSPTSQGLGTDTSHDSPDRLVSWIALPAARTCVCTRIRTHIFSPAYR